MKQCSNCARTFPTRYEWAHHGCQTIGLVRDLNALHRPGNLALRTAIFKMALESTIASRIFPNVPYRSSDKPLTWVKVDAAGRMSPTDEPPPAAHGVVQAAAPQTEYARIEFDGIKTLRMGVPRRPTREG